MQTAATLRTMLLNTGIAAILLVAFQVEVFSQEQTRTWVSRIGNESVEASFQSFDPKNKIVSLQLQDGETLQVNLKQLSRADQRHVVSLFRNNAKSQQPTVIDRQDTKKQRFATRHTNPNDRNAFGIRWTPGIQSALQRAAGANTDQDDRPVMCLRVLGDLAGFM